METLAAGVLSAGLQRFSFLSIWHSHSMCEAAMPGVQKIESFFNCRVGSIVGPFTARRGGRR